jgi:hypothetical protein
MTKGGTLRLFVPSCGVWFDPIGVARLSFGGCLLGIANGGRAEFSDMGGAAALLTGLWFGDAGMARPNRGTLLPDCDLPAPGMGGRSNGAGDAMSYRSGASTESLSSLFLGSATLGRQAWQRGCQKAAGCAFLTAWRDCQEYV